MKEVYPGGDRGLKEFVGLIKLASSETHAVAILRGLQEAAYRAGVAETVLRLSKKETTSARNSKSDKRGKAVGG